jgi:hypothetical protein
MDRRLDAQISVRLGHDDVAQLDRLEERFGGVISKANLARTAMRVGMTALEKNPTLLVSAVAEPDRRAAAMQAAGAFVDAETEERIARRVIELHGQTLDRLAK